MYGPTRPSKIRAGVRVEERSVDVERAILDRDRDLVVGLVRRELVVRLRRRAGQDGHAAVAGVEDDVIRAAAHDVEAGRTRIDVESGHPERVVVVPDRRGTIGIRVLERRVARAPVHAEAGLRLAGEEVVPRPLRRVAGRDVPGRRQVPGLRVAVALVTDADRAVDMGHHRDRARVGSGRRRRTPGGCRDRSSHPAGSPSGALGRPGEDAAGSSRPRPRAR